MRNWKQFVKRSLVLVLTLSMIIGSVDMTVFAAEFTENDMEFMEDEFLGTEYEIYGDESLKNEYEVYEDESLESEYNIYGDESPESDFEIYEDEMFAVDTSEIESVGTFDNEEGFITDDVEIELPDSSVSYGEEEFVTEAWISEFSETPDSEEVVSVEVVDLGSLSLDLEENSAYSESLEMFSASTGRCDLAGGNYYKWVDRMNVPAFVLTFYNRLVEAADNDGYQDFLISDAAFSKANARKINTGYGYEYFSAVQYCALKNPTYAQREYVYATLRAAFDAFTMDHPEVFWLSGNTRACYVQSGSTYTFYLLLKVHSGSVSSTFDMRESNYGSASAIKADIKVRDNAVTNILNSSGVKSATSVYGVIRALNEWLTKNCEYNTKLSLGIGYEGKRAHNCLSALTGGYGVNGPVCEAYAKAFKILCNKKGIPCALTVGDAGEAHMWNSVRLYGVWYEVDVTWNDPTTGYSAGRVSGYENEDYLLVGKDTYINGSRFQYSHTTTNDVSTAPFDFPNGPVISSSAYVHKSQSTTPDTLNYVMRLGGATRYDTSLTIARKLSDVANRTTFNSVIIASGKDFADALAGSYLAKKTNAPILMTNGKNGAALKSFINTYLTDGGTIYILGGTAAVARNIESSFKGLGTIYRIAGDTRYNTNLLILYEAGVSKQDILVCTGKDFPDSLAASATGKPLLLVNNKSLSAAQKTFLNLVKGSNIYVIGGTGVVSKSFENTLKSYGTTQRVAGANRYETSVKIAEKFFKNPRSAVLAYAWNFPDGLCGGPLASTINGPLILTKPGKENAAVNYMSKNGIHTGFVLGSSELIPDYLAIEIFGL